MGTKMALVKRTYAFSYRIFVLAAFLLSVFEVLAGDFGPTVYFKERTDISQPAQQMLQARSILLEKALEQGKIRLIVGLTLPEFNHRIEQGARAITELERIEAQRDEISAIQEEVLNGLNPVNVAKIHKYPFIPYMAVEADAAGLDALIAHPQVNMIQEDIPVPPVLSQSVPLIDGDLAWNSGYTGSGQTVAILDSGVQTNHPFLSGKIVSEACFSTTYTGSSYSSTSLCPNGLSSQTGTGAGVNCSSSLSGCSHGTHVAGIVGGRGSSFSGVAKDAGLISIQVFSQFTPASCGSSSPCIMSWSSDQIAAMQYLYTLRSTYHIASVNMSLGGGKYTSQSTCDSDNSATKAAIDTLRAANIAVVIASGNNGYTNGISAPGCISSAISVGATTKSDTIASYSNSASFLSLLAPGSSIYSSVLTNSYAYYNGTSMATPHVAGAWAILKQKKPTATIAEVLSALQSTGVVITDTRNSISKPRIDIDNAASTLTGAVPGAFNKSTPANGATGQAINPTLSWGSSTEASSYEYCYDTVNNNSCDGSWVSTGAAASATLSGLSGNTVYYWQVRARNSGGVTEANNGTWWSLRTQDLVNYALSGTVTQSSTLSTGVAALANDGNTDGNWYGGSLTHTAKNIEAWWQVDLGVIRTINNIQVWNRTDCCSERLSNFYIFVSDSPFVSTGVNATKAQSGVSNYYTAGQGGRPTTATVNRTGRYVRVQLAGENCLSLAEVQVWGINAGISVPGAFNKSAPANGATGQAINPTLSWGSSTEASSYEYCYDTVNNNSCDGTWSSTGATASATLSGLSGNTVYYWQVRARNSAGVTEANTGTWWSLRTQDLVNYALSGTVTQSSTLSTGVAARANDGNTDGNWYGGSVTHTANNTEAWWQVDLGVIRTINNIQVWNRTDCCSERLNNFYIFVSDSPFVSTGVNATKAQSGVSNYYTAGQGGRPTTATVNRTGRYVRVQLAGTNFLSLAEVQVWGINAGISVPGAFSKSAPANGATGQAINPTLSWGSSTEASSYEYCYDTVNNNSCDGTWSSTGATASATLSGLSGNTVYYWQVRARNSAGVTEANTGTWWSLQTQNLVNYALSGTVTQSSTLSTGVAARANDGNTDGNWYGGSVTHTANNTEAWWQVDLGVIRTINNIQVWNRTDCCSERLNNFYIFVSDSPFASTGMNATKAQSGVSNYHTTGQGGRPTTATVNRTGRYVRVQLAGTNFLSLAEVQIWGGSTP